MIQDNRLHLPWNWEKILEQIMIRNPTGEQCERIYICSPLRADTAGGLIRNMMAARVYMFYAYQHFPGVPIAPHAYLPILLNDSDRHERDLALAFGKKLLDCCNKLFVCGSNLSEGMYGEVKIAVKRCIPVTVFNHKVYTELCECFDINRINPITMRYEEGHLHFALSWDADELAPYWEGASI